MKIFLSKKDEMYTLLETHFQPFFLELVDESFAHRGHKGVSSSDSETHFKLRIKSPLLEGLSVVAQHQQIYTVLKPFFERKGLHALTIQVIPCS